MTKIRTIAATALAADTFGGTVGALATAANQSQASPAAIAAAVQRVSDSRLTSAVKALGGKLDAADSALGGIERSLLSPRDTSGLTIGDKLDLLNRNLGGPSGPYNGSATVEAELKLICENTRNPSALRDPCPAGN